MSGFDESFDFVVVGSGAGSLSAALYQRSVGRSVVVLEKTELVGGSTARSGGVMWIPNNPFMKQEGVPDSYEQARTYLDGVIGNPPDAPGATPARRHAYLTEAPRLIDFLLGQGIKLRRVPLWPDYYDDRPGGCASSRTVVAQLFDTNELPPEWRPRLRPTLMPMAANIDDIMNLATIRVSWATKLLALRVGIKVTWDRVLGRRMVTSGAALQGRMLHAVLRTGADVRIQSPVTQLIVENGAVTGVVTTRDGKPWRIGARTGVLVGAGGFAHNQRMRDQYKNGVQADWSLTPNGDTGEMIEEMMRHGAAIAQMTEFVGNQQTHPPGSEKSEFKQGAQSVTAKPHCILVDQSGKRYMNEGGSYMAYCKGMLERNKTVPAVPSYAIMDTQYLRKYLLAGTMPGINNKPKSWFEQGYMRKADTIEALAQQLKIDPAALKSTVERWNGFVARGRDDDFQRGARAYDRWLGDPYHKPNATLGAISEAPFYSVPVVPGDVSTYGGVVTDEHARVLRADGSVIRGLYATGVSTASVMGPVYPGAGASIGPSITFGYIASRHAAAQK
jgi:3-oxosteroid 1-dehydrogenase